MKFFTIIFAIFVLGSVGAEDLEYKEENNPLLEKEQDLSNVLSTKSTPTIAVTVRLSIFNYANDVIRPLYLNVQQGTTAFEILQQAAKIHPCYRFKYKSYSFGHFITSICCIDQDPSAKLYWMIYINGKPSQVGADDLKPSAGDHLAFKYQEVNEH